MQYNSDNNVLGSVWADKPRLFAVEDWLLISIYQCHPISARPEGNEYKYGPANLLNQIRKQHNIRYSYFMNR